MASYYYLISSLPMLRPDAEPALDYTAFLGLCRTAVSQPVYQRLETLTVRSEKGPLLAEWAAFYGGLTTELNYQRNLKLGRPCTLPGSREPDVTAAVTAALAARNPLESEQILLKLQFSRLDSLIGLHNFDEFALFGYAMKLRLLERQRGFRYETGKQTFEGLLGNIRQPIFSM